MIRRTLCLASVLVLSATFSAAQSASNPPVRGWLGVKLGELTSSTTPGIRVLAVADASPALAASIQRGDIIRAVNGRPMTNVPAALEMFGAPGSPLHLTVMTLAGTMREIDISLGTAPRYLSGDCYLGNADLGLGGTIAADGAFVVTVSATDGLVAGDRLVSINGAAVTAANIYQIESQFAVGETAAVDVVRGGRTQRVQARFGCAPSVGDLSAAARQWQADAVKPVMSAAAVRERALAEAAVKQGNFVGAAFHYAYALASFPYWPEGWFNTAVILGDNVHAWGAAAAYMQHYVDFASNAPDVEAARNQIAKWRQLAKPQEAPSVAATSASGPAGAASPLPAGECEYGSAAIGMYFVPTVAGGLYIKYVSPTARRAGVLPDDVLTEFDGIKPKFKELQKLLANVDRHTPGDIVRIKILQRNNNLKSRELMLPLGCRPVGLKINQFLAQWRQTTPAPALPEITHKYEVLAEDALREKQPYTAVSFYVQGLAAYPFWPKAWYNAALIWAEVGDLVTAADYMNWYLTLAPDAPDARAARDQMIIWQEKSKS